MRTIILASTSPRRKELLAKLGIPFKVVASSYHEDMTLKLKPRQLAKHLSVGKAEAVAKKHSNAIIIAADTFIALKDRLLGKPDNLQQAKKMLQAISGRKHKIITGITILDSRTGLKISQAIETVVTMRNISPREIEQYVRTGEPLDKAGAYAIQGKGAVFITSIQGDYHGAVGLSLYAIAQMLKRFGIDVLKN